MTELTAQDMSADEAREFVRHVRASVEDIKDWIVRAVKGRAWVALGYGSWDAMCEAEFDGAVIRLPREDRKEFVGSLRDAGLSMPAIASAAGVSVGTVHSDLSEMKSRPETVTSLDGRKRPASQPPRDEPAEKPRLASPESGTWYSGPPDLPEPDDGPPEPTPLPDRQGEADAAVHRIEQAAEPERPVGPSKAVLDYIGADPAWQDQAYVTAFSKALARGHNFMAFDPGRLGRIGPESMADELDSYLAGVEKFITAFRTARRGLRVIEGGQ